MQLIDELIAEMYFRRPQPPGYPAPAATPGNPAASYPGRPLAAAR
jgi:hypothetical protein